MGDDLAHVTGHGEAGHGCVGPPQYGPSTVSTERATAADGSGCCRRPSWPSSVTNPPSRPHRPPGGSGSWPDSTAAINSASRASARLLRPGCRVLGLSRTTSAGVPCSGRSRPRRSGATPRTGTACAPSPQFVGRTVGKRWGGPCAGQPTPPRPAPSWSGRRDRTRDPHLGRVMRYMQMVRRSGLTCSSVHETVHQVRSGPAS